MHLSAMFPNVGVALISRLGIIPLNSHTHTHWCGLRRRCEMEVLGGERWWCWCVRMHQYTLAPAHLNTAHASSSAFGLQLNWHAMKNDLMCVMIPYLHTHGCFCASPNNLHVKKNVCINVWDDMDSVLTFSRIQLPTSSPLSSQSALLFSSSVARMHQD